MADGDFAFALYAFGDSGHQVDQPVLPGLLKTEPCGIVPVDDAGEFIAGFTAKTESAVLAVADARPKRHIAEQTVDLVVCRDFLCTCEYVVAVR